MQYSTVVPNRITSRYSHAVHEQRSTTAQAPMASIRANKVRYLLKSQTNTIASSMPQCARSKKLSMAIASPGTRCQSLVRAQYLLNAS